MDGGLRTGLPHPTPLHIRMCLQEEISRAAREWHAETGAYMPTSWVLKAIEDGVTRACSEHQENER